jgi:hypothetical protein
MNWLYKDPLRGVSIDKWPYAMSEGEQPLDFMFKSMVYSTTYLILLLFEPVGLVGLVGLWVGVNFLRRNK